MRELRIVCFQDNLLYVLFCPFFWPHSTVKGNHKSPNWKTTAASLKLSEKLELSEDGLKVTIQIYFQIDAFIALSDWLRVWPNQNKIPAEKNFKVRRKTPLANFISSIKSIKSVVVTSDSEMTVAGNIFILPQPNPNSNFTLSPQRKIWILAIQYEFRIDQLVVMLWWDRFCSSYKRSFWDTRKS